MNKNTERLKEIAQARELFSAEVETPDVTEERLAEIEKETRSLNKEEQEIRAKMALEEHKEVREVEKKDTMTREAQFRATGKMELRAVLSTGNIAKPSVATGINDLAAIGDMIVDDVFAVPVNGVGAYTVAYKLTDAQAAAVTDGSAIGGTGSTYHYKTITPGTWGVVDEVSNLVKTMSDVDYLSAVEKTAIIALRAKASDNIIAALASSSIAEAKTGVALDKDYLRGLLLGFNSIPGKGNVKLYINRTDLQTLGAVRGTNEKRALYDIKYDEGTTLSGIISEGGSAVPFRIIDGITTGTQYFGQPKTIHMPMWGQYEVATDEGGKYFEKNQIGVRGLQTAGVDLCAYHGMQKITQA